MADVSSVPAGRQADGGDAFQPRDRILRLFKAVPVPPVWVGLAIALAYVALFVAFAGFTGIFSPGGPAESWGSQVLVWESVTGLIVAYLDNLQAKVDHLKELQAKTSAELDALLPSILDKAFKGEL